MSVPGKGMWRWLRDRYYQWRYRPDLEMMRAVLSQHLVKCDDKGGEMVNRLYHWKEPKK